MSVGMPGVYVDIDPPEDSIVFGTCSGEMGRPADVSLNPEVLLDKLIIYIDRKWSQISKGYEGVNSDIVPTSKKLRFSTNLRVLERVASPPFPFLGLTWASNLNKSHD